MSTGWLISYIILWTIVVALCIIVIGLLERLGMLLHRDYERMSTQMNEIIKLSAEEEQKVLVPPVSEDGPVLGSAIPEVLLNAHANYGIKALTGRSGGSVTLVVFMAPLCESCQRIIDPLNHLIDEHIFDGQVLVILRADEIACQAFLSVFPLHIPVICDQDHTISMGLNIHRNPFGLLYNSQGKLIRKGSILDYEAILALLGDTSVSPAVQSSIYSLSEPRAARS
jgi:thiol-disulfide isomerase/thioredoxin